MAFLVMATGTPDVGGLVSKLADELVYAMGGFVDLEQVPLLKPDTIILSLYATDPSKGSIPGGTSFKRSQGEFWSSRSITYARFASGDLAEKLAAVGDALIEAIEQVPRTRMSDDAKAKVTAAVAPAIQVLLGEPERFPGLQLSVSGT